MRKYTIILLFIVMVTLSGCGANEEDTNTFLIRKEYTFITEDDSVIVDFKTDENGELVELNIDRLLRIDEMIYYNTTIDYEFELEGFSGEIYTYSGSQCTDFDDLLVPVNIEVGNTRYLYNRTYCQYVEVDRDNEPKLGNLVRTFRLTDTIPVSKDVQVSVVVFDEESIERFVEVDELPHTMKMIGVYSIGLNYERDGFRTQVFNYNRDVRVFEQLILKNQDDETAINEANGLPTEINLLEFDLNDEYVPLIDDFAELYELEVRAIEELFLEIRVITEDVTGTDNDDTPDDSSEGTTDDN